MSGLLPHLDKSQISSPLAGVTQLAPSHDCSSQLLLKGPLPSCAVTSMSSNPQRKPEEDTKHRHDDRPIILDPGFTLDDALSFVVDALRDPLNPGWCSPSILACMIVMRNNDSVTDSETLAMVGRCHAFGSAAVAFLTIKRIDSLWAKCRCSPTDVANNSVANIMHDMAVSSLGGLLSHSPHRNITQQHSLVSRYGNQLDYLALVVKALNQLLSGAISQVKPMNVARGRLPHMWPTSPNDLIPFGNVPTLL